MVDLSQPASAAEFQAAGVDAATAANLAMQHNIMTGRAGTFEERVAVGEAVRNLAPVPSAPAPASTTPAQATAALAAHEEAQLQGHLEQLYQGASSPLEYRIPVTAGELSDEALAADSALQQMLYTQRLPRDLGNAILQDVASGRPSPYAKSAEASAALKPFLSQLLTAAQADAAISKHLPPGLQAEHLLAALSPETAMALLPYVQHRAKRQ
jgi:hypothetical protein